MTKKREEEIRRNNANRFSYVFIQKQRLLKIVKVCNLVMAR